MNSITRSQKDANVFKSDYIMCTFLVWVLLWRNKLYIGLCKIPKILLFLTTTNEYKGVAVPVKIWMHG